MLSNVPVGLFITHHLSRALVLSPCFMLAGALLLAGGGGFVTLMLGRALMGWARRWACWAASPLSCATGRALASPPHSTRWSSRRCSAS
jgi:hypothetical protein